MIDWDVLGRAIDCNHCRCRFIVQRDGKVVALDELPQVTFTCPRCRASGSMATLLATGGTTCTKCELPLQLGPDNRVHSAEVAARLRKEQAIKQAKSTPASFNQYAQLLKKRDGTWSFGRIAMVAFVLISFLGGTTWQLVHYFDRSPTTLAERMVRMILAGDTDRAEAFIADDAVQQVEFERWHLRHLSSLRDAYRPKGDRAKIDVAVLDDGEKSKHLELILSSQAIGRRTYQMRWEVREDRWVFDAFQTLSMEDQPKTVAKPKRRNVRLPQGRPTRIPNLVPSGP